MLYNLAWIVPLLPLISFVLLVAFGNRLKEKAAYLGIFFISGSFVLATSIFIQKYIEKGENYIYTFQWLEPGGAEYGLANSSIFNLGFEITALNALMLFVVSIISLTVFVYSIGYMRHDERLPTFYSYLSLFSFSMLSLVISPNLFQAFIFWELVGATSFLLIGFYFHKESAKAAAKKAFIVTRLADVGLLIGILLIFWQVGSFEYSDIFAAISQGSLAPWVITTSAILIFIGAAGKSGQFPFHVWLPDAMEGPTPVSALIHAATMVAAGVYLVARLFPLFAASEVALLVVAAVGAFTAIFAASIALTQNDIKRVLAYSTVSQLGYMMLALGTLGYIAAVFHLFTHAFFKALLFLAAGSVIHAIGTQNIKKMGGVGKNMKLTRAVFLIGALTISGFPLLAGFFSKDMIFLSVYANNYAIFFWVSILTALLTAFYMFRLYFLVFTDQPRTQFTAQESPRSMTVPMVVLAFFAVFAGYIEFFGFGDFISGGGTIAQEISGPIWIIVASIIVALLGIILAWLAYGRNPQATLAKKPKPALLYKLSYNKFYMDELNNLFIVQPYRVLSRMLAAFDKFVIENLVQLAVNISVGLGRFGARIQGGQIQAYTLLTVLGIATLLIGLVVRGLIG